MQGASEPSADLTLRRFSILTTTSSRRSFQAKRNHTLQKMRQLRFHSLWGTLQDYLEYPICHKLFSTTAHRRMPLS